MKRVDTINRKKIDIVSVALALVAVVLIGLLFLQTRLLKISLM